MLARTLALLMTAALSLPASAAFADPQRAAEYYDEASEAYQSGDLRKAADLLDQAFAEDPDLVYKYNRILALQGLGEYENALAELKALYAPMKADPQNRFDDIDQVKAQLENSIEAKEAAAQPADTGEETEGTAETAGGSDVTVGEQAPPPKKEPNILAYSLLGGGVVVGGLGGLFATGIMMRQDTRHCASRVLQSNPNRGDCAAYAERKGFGADLEAARTDANQVASKQVIPTISFISAGVVLAAVGLVLLLTDSGAESSEASSSSNTGIDSLQVAPMFGANAGGAMLQLRF